MLLWFNFESKAGTRYSVLAPTRGAAERMLPEDFGTEYRSYMSIDPDYQDRLASPWAAQVFTYYHHPNGGVVRTNEGYTQIIAGSPQGVLQEHTDLDKALKWVEENS